MLQSALSAVVIILEMESAIRVQILDEANSISFSTNVLGKDMNTSVFALG